MRRLGYFLLLLVMLLVTVLTAQGQAPDAVPQDELVQAWLAQAQLAGELANAACQATDQAKRYTALRADVVKKVEARVPGFTVNWQTGKLAPKAAAAK